MKTRVAGARRIKGKPTAAEKGE
jgi:hypothetical protein